MYLCVRLCVLQWCNVGCLVSGGSLLVLLWLLVVVLSVFVSVAVVKIFLVLVACVLLCGSVVVCGRFLSIT